MVTVEKKRDFAQVRIEGQMPGLLQRLSILKEELDMQWRSWRDGNVTDPNHIRRTRDTARAIYRAMREVQKTLHNQRHMR